MTISPGDSTKSFSHLVGIEIKVAMARREIRQSQLARKMGVTEQWLSVRLRGVQEIGLNDLAQIAEALDVEINDLLPGRVPAHTLRNFETASDLPEQPTPQPDSQPERPRRNPRRQTTRPGSNPPAGSPDERTRRPSLIRRAHSV